MTQSISIVKSSVKQYYSLEGKVMAVEHKYESMVTAARTAQNNRFNGRKQGLHTCVLQFGTLLYRSRQNNNVK